MIIVKTENQIKKLILELQSPLMQVELFIVREDISFSFQIIKFKVVFIEIYVYFSS